MSHDDHTHAPPPPQPGEPLDGGHGGHGADRRLEAAHNPPPPGAQDSHDRVVPPPTPNHGRSRGEALRGGDGILRPISESEYFAQTPEAEAIVSSHIDEYFNQPLDIFPFWESESKPDRFHVLFSRQIEERFPVDRDIRSRIHAYGRRVFRALIVHVSVKRITQAGALAAFAALAILGPGWFSQWTGTEQMGLALAAGAMLATFGVFWALQAILFIQYRFQLENDSYELSREVVQRTRELQNLFTSARAMADQAETQFQMDGKGWGRRAMYLTRLTMWIGARMEYLEKHVQMELWRVRRERYWMRWAQRIMTPLVLIAGLVVLALEPAPETGEAGFRGLQVLAAVLGVAVSWLSYFRWRTPVAAVQDKLGVDGWVRYASLDVDNAVADQVRRDKERLVEYRALTRGR
jgi:membrane protein implicated in regulation of membrane protease activity